MFNNRIYTRYEDIPQKDRDKFHLNKHFKNQKQFDSFMKWQNFKSKFGFFYWSPSGRDEVKIGEGKTVRFDLAKKL